MFLLGIVPYLNNHSMLVTLSLVNTLVGSQPCSQLTTLMLGV